MSDSPLVSIIMNCHNSSKFLKKAIQSVYDQSYKNWEIIFWDNKSVDSSKDIVFLFDNKIKYFYSKDFTNLGKARKDAAAKANGKYLAFLDCDDYWHPSKLEKQIQIFENEKNSIGIVYGRTEYLYMSKGKKIVYNRNKSMFEGMIFDKLIQGNFISFVSAVVDKQKFFEVGGFPSHLKHSTDYWIFLKIAAKYPVKALDEVCATYRVHDSNLSKKLNIIGINEGIEVISEFNNYKDVGYAKKLMRARLALSYLMESKFNKFFLLVIKYSLLKSIFLIFFKRIQGSKLHF